VSIHTLAAAGYEELVDILHHEGRRTRLEESSEIVIKPEFHALAQKMMRRAQNFFKHADKDPDGLLDFDPREPQFLLFACVDAYPTLTGSSSARAMVVPLVVRAGVSGLLEAGGFQG
jgi:hypothetical protein